MAWINAGGASEGDRARFDFIAEEDECQVSNSLLHFREPDGKISLNAIAIFRINFDFEKLVRINHHSNPLQ